MFAQLILRYCMCSAFETNTSDKNCIQLSLIWDQAELSSSTESSAMRFSFVAVVNKHTVYTCFNLPIKLGAELLEA